MYNNITTIRYMGNKNKLLNFIIPEIEKITPKGKVVCDMMAGTNSIGYALKENYVIYSNDVQEYSKCISDAIIVNNKYSLSKKQAFKDLKENIDINMEKKMYSFFEDVYTDTYFSRQQCKEIDSIRYAIEKIKIKEIKALYLTALMSAMCKVQSTPGHFAQFMPKENKRIQILREMSLKDEFFEKCEDFSLITDNKKKNIAYNLNYKEMIKLPEMKDVETFYLDSPYSGEQYSRFYHVLETVVKYDNPSVHFKAKYRDDRFMSDFCYKSKVLNEFENIISFCSLNNSNLVISYSNKGVVSCDLIEQVAKKYYNNVEVKTNEYSHSTQGKGSNKLLEYLFILKK